MPEFAIVLPAEPTGEVCGDGVPGKAKPECYFRLGGSGVGKPEDLVHCLRVESHGEQL